MRHHPRRAIARLVVLSSLLGAAAIATATAQTHGAHDRDPGADGVGATASSDADEFTEGEVRRIDRESGRLTLRHGPLRNLDMPGMTMVFDVADAAVLDRLRPGERVRFQAGKVDGRFVVTRIEPASSSSRRGRGLGRSLSPRRSRLWRPPSLRPEMSLPSL